MEEKLKPIKDSCELLSVEEIMKGVEVPKAPDGWSLDEISAKWEKVKQIDLNVEIEMENKAQDWIAEKIREGIEVFTKLADEAIKLGNKQIDAAVGSMNKACASFPDEKKAAEKETPVEGGFRSKVEGKTATTTTAKTTTGKKEPTDEATRTQLMDDAVRRMRRRALSKEERLAIDETAPLHTTRPSHSPA